MASIFKPENNKFYQLYTYPAEKLVAMSKLLESMLYVSLDEKKRLAREIGVLEHEANDDRQNIIEEIATSFITPFDRDDMFDLARAIESSIGLIDNAAELLIMIQFDDVDYLPSKVTKQMELIRQSSDAVSDGISNLKNIAKLQSYWDLIDHNESEADRFRRSMLTKLYTLEPDPMRLFKVKEIIEIFEDIMDSLKHISHVCETIALKDQ